MLLFSDILEGVSYIQCGMNSCTNFHFPLRICIHPEYNVLFLTKSLLFHILNGLNSDVQCFIVKPVMNLPPNYKDKPVPEQILK